MQKHPGTTWLIIKNIGIYIQKLCIYKYSVQNTLYSLWPSRRREQFSEKLGDEPPDPSFHGNEVYHRSRISRIFCESVSKVVRRKHTMVTKEDQVMARSFSPFGFRCLLVGCGWWPQERRWTKEMRRSTSEFVSVGAVWWDEIRLWFLLRRQFDFFYRPLPNCTCRYSISLKKEISICMLDIFITFQYVSLRKPWGTAVAQAILY